MARALSFYGDANAIPNILHVQKLNTLTKTLAQSARGSRSFRSRIEKPKLSVQVSQRRTRNPIYSSEAHSLIPFLECIPDTCYWPLQNLNILFKYSRQKHFF